MLDELLGRAELKDRIADLEEEVGHLEARYEAESERRSEAVRARQEAEERVNRLEDRIADLEGQLETADDETELSFRGREPLSRARLRSVLGRLRSLKTDPEGALTAFVEADALPETVARAVGDRAPLVRRAAPCLVCVDDAGVVAVTLDPPMAPRPFCEWSDGFEVDDEWFLPQDGDALALVRSDLFVLGTYGENGEWTVRETVESDVKSAHSKGGFSQGRFERRRDAQVDEHVEKSLDVLAERAGSSGRLVVVGEKTVLGAFEERADHLARVDASGDPEAAFSTAVDDFFTTRLSLL